MKFSLITADFVAITVLITMGAVLGKLTPVQYMVMSAIEVPVAVAVEHLILRYLKVSFIELVTWLLLFLSKNRSFFRRICC